MAPSLNLRTRILLGYLPPVLLMAMVSGVVSWKVRSAMQIDASANLARNILTNLKDIQLATVQLQRSARGYLLKKNDASKQIFAIQIARLPDLRQTLSRLVTEPGQIETARAIMSQTDVLVRVASEEMRQVDAGNGKEALELFRAGSIEIGRELDAMLEDFESREVEILAERDQEKAAALSGLVTVVLGATAVAMLLAVALGLWTASRISGSIVEAIAGMTTSSAQIAATVDEHERVVMQQAAAVNETTSTVEELGASSRQSAAQAESAASATKQALELTQEGIRLAGEVAGSMSALKEKVDSVAERILRLSEQAAQIGGIARVVAELAGETNMLALNAAVEAARAGEHGKGFAVIATEIRKLADQSKKSAERANLLVVEIQKATNSAVMVTEEGSRTADAVAATVARTTEAFDAISHKAGSVSISAQQVLLNSKQQANALGQVTEAMKGIAAGSTQMAAGTAQTKAGIQSLNQIALSLKAMV